MIWEGYILDYGTKLWHSPRSPIQADGTKLGRNTWSPIKTGIQLSVLNSNFDMHIATLAMNTYQLFSALHADMADKSDAQILQILHIHSLF